MEDIYFENAPLCNFCFDHDNNEGISWDAGKLIKPYPWSDPVKAYYHVCNKCAMLFRKRQIGKYKNLDKHGEYKRIEEENTKFVDLRSKIAAQLKQDQNTKCKKKHEEKYTIVPELVKQFSDEEEDWLAAYGYIINGEKVESKRIKGQQTYIRNRLYDEKTIANLVKWGHVNTVHQGMITLDEIGNWYIWNEEERERIDEIVKMRKQTITERESKSKNDQS